jgi:murein DD-endopeptidase MepM/ murein hydrolase activator NlpD
VSGDGIGAAASALEAYFLRQVFASVKSSGGGLAGTGFAGSTFQDMFQEALADAMASGGGLGLADQLRDNLGALAPPPLPPPTGSGVLTTLPVDGGMSWGFGDRVINGHPGHHYGVDLGAPEGTPIRAAGDGRVVRTGVARGYGNLVVIDHGDGVETRYAHLSKIGVEVGDPIAAGQVVGESGETGNAIGPHLHFEVRRDGEAVDPRGELPLPAPRKHRP